MRISPGVILRAAQPGSEPMSTQTLSLGGKDAGTLWIWGDLEKALTFSSISLGNHQKSICHRNKRDLRLLRSTLGLSLGSTWGPGERTGEEEVSRASHQGLEPTDLTGNARTGGCLHHQPHHQQTLQKYCSSKTASVWNLTALHGILCQFHAYSLDFSLS